MRHNPMGDLLFKFRLFGAKGSFTILAMVYSPEPSQTKC